MENNKKYLKLLAQKYPTKQAVSSEIINLSAICNLPKGTEHFMSDIHGEYEAFCHILNNCSGVIHEKVDLLFRDTLSNVERQEICTLIYYPKEKLEMLHKECELPEEWYRMMLGNLIEVAKLLSSKYTRSKVRKAMPKEFAYIIDELLHVQKDEDDNQVRYHKVILDTILNIHNGDEFIIALANLIKRLAVDHLHIVGDIFDRGKDVPQIFWLFYKLEKEAADAGGHVSFLLGNHEPLVTANDLRYTKEKYKTLARKLGMDYPALFGPDTELGKWLGTRNTMQTIGPNLYVHAGLGKEFYDRDLNIPTVNEEMSRALFMSKKERKALSPLTAFLYGNSGPIWYRGLVRTDAKYHPLAQDSLQLMLKRYDVEHIIVGHTIFKDISTFYDGRVIGVNVDNEENRKKKRGRALLIDGNTYLVVGDKGAMRKLF